jgi:hypothetical protein
VYRLGLSFLLLQWIDEEAPHMPSLLRFVNACQAHTLESCRYRPKEVIVST